MAIRIKVSKTITTNAELTQLLKHLSVEVEEATDGICYFPIAGNLMHVIKLLEQNQVLYETDFDVEIPSNS